MSQRERVEVTSIYAMSEGKKICSYVSFLNSMKVAMKMKELGLGEVRLWCKEYNDKMVIREVLLLQGDDHTLYTWSQASAFVYSFENNLEWRKKVGKVSPEFDIPSEVKMATEDFLTGLYQLFHSPDKLQGQELEYFKQMKTKYGIVSF